MWKILVVDDEFANRKLLIEVLKEYGTCDAAASGQEALTAFKSSYEAKSPYDVVLLDVAMPDIDGLGVLQQARDFEEKRGIVLGKGVPIVMVTAHPKTFMKSFYRGADEFVAKPVDPEKLIRKMKDVLDSRKTAE
jgi:two-component system chemotaxis response regulator CheY